MRTTSLTEGIDSNDKYGKQQFFSSNSKFPLGGEKKTAKIVKIDWHFLLALHCLGTEIALNNLGRKALSLTP